MVYEALPNGRIGEKVCFRQHLSGGLLLGTRPIGGKQGDAEKNGAVKERDANPNVGRGASCRPEVAQVTRDHAIAARVSQAGAFNRRLAPLVAPDRKADCPPGRQIPGFRNSISHDAFKPQPPLNPVTAYKTIAAPYQIASLEAIVAQLLP